MKKPTVLFLAALCAPTIPNAAAFLKTASRQQPTGNTRAGARSSYIKTWTTSIYNNHDCCLKRKTKVENNELRPSSSQRNLFIVPMEWSITTTTTTSDTIEAINDIMNASKDNQQILEAEVFADLAHLILDVATIFTPDTIVFRFFVLCGRIFSILSDYIPDKAMTVDELIFQSCMLILASTNFVTMVVPFIVSSSQKGSMKDRRIYQSIFRSVGFTWNQFMFLVANGSLEWVDVQPNSTLIETNENFLITYRGLVSKDCSTVYGKSPGRKSHEIIGDLTSTKELVDGYDHGYRYRYGMISSRKEKTNHLQILTTEDEHVSLLRINTERLLLSARNDPRMDSAIKQLLFRALLSFYSKNE